MDAAVRPEADDRHYHRQRASIEQYFEHTAAHAWDALTSNSPVSRIRRSVRQGRERMRHTLAGWLPADLTGLRVYDAGCGTGMLAADLAGRNAEVTAVDLSGKLAALAAKRAADHRVAERVRIGVGDMLDTRGERFDYVIAMDSVIHYRTEQAIEALARLAAAADRGLLFTLVPGNPVLRAFKSLGRLFPQGNRAPAVQLISDKAARGCLARHPGLRGWRLGRSVMIQHGFYTSRAYELTRIG